MVTVQYTMPYGSFALRNLIDAEANIASCSSTRNSVPPKVSQASTNGLDRHSSCTELLHFRHRAFIIGPMLESGQSPRKK